MYLYSNISAALLFVETATPLETYAIYDAEGKEVSCPKLRCEQKEDVFVTTLDATALKPWSVNHPVLYTLEAAGKSVRFGHTSISTIQNKMILLNEKPIYLRGYIRGIIAHEHPNMTGKSDYEAALKNIRQAKKYGFNFVRFHSTIPSDDFLRAADELGLLVHLETGLTLRKVKDEQTGEIKKVLGGVGGELWNNTILRLRNHPSVAVICCGNELHNSAQYPEVVEAIRVGRELAPSKLFLDNCGWGEYDRTSADIFIQHMGYYLPYDYHNDMFTTDVIWRMNASAYQIPLTLESETGHGTARISRHCEPIRPTLSHEAMHYVDIPDYAAMEKKFDDFCEKVGPEYLEKHGITKPKYFAGLRKLIAQRGIEDIMPEYIAASRKTKLICTKIFLEKLRLSNLCGHEMLQFSDCLKYENKNGIVDFFDDDKGIDPEWMRSINDELVLVADFKEDRFYEDEPIEADIYASDFLEDPQIVGTLELTLEGKIIYTGEKFSLAGGLQKLVDLRLPVTPSGKPQARILGARFVSDSITVSNSWKIWTYPRVRPNTVPETDLTNQALADYLQKGTKKSDIYVTDTFNQKVFDKLESGNTVVLLYEYLAERNSWNVPGAIERFKPCIWDRGNNLGGILANPAVEAALGDDRYFDKNVQPLIDLGHKVNLDNWPCKVTEHVMGIDKPIRDRFRVSRDGVKDFVPEDTLRRFSHLFSMKVGNGTLVVCTFNLKNPENPVISNFLELLIDRTELFATDSAIAPEAFKEWLEKVNAEPFREEDRMNAFWQDDNEFPVEKVLFWEDLGLNLAAIK